MAKRAASSQLSDLSLDALAHELCFFKALVRPGPHEASPVKHVPCLQEALMCVLNAAGWEGSHELCFRVALRNNFTRVARLCRRQICAEPLPRIKEMSSRPSGCGLPQPEAEGSAFKIENLSSRLV